MVSSFQSFTNLSFQSFTNLSLKNLFSKGGQGIGIELTPDRINIAQLHKQGQQGLKVLHLCSIPILEDGIFQDGQIVNPAAMSELLRTALEENGIKAKRVATAVTGREAVTRLIPIPAELDDRELRDMVLNQEAGLYLPFPREEADVDYQKLGFFVDDDGIEKVKVLLAATRREVTDVYLETFREANLEVDVLEISNFALIRTIRSQLQQFTSREAVAIADIGFESTEIAIVMDGVPQFARTVPIGLYQVQAALRHAMNLPPSRDLEILLDMTVPSSTIDSQGSGKLKGTQPGIAAMMRVIGELADELRRSIDFYLSQGEDLEVVQLLLAGLGGGIDQLDQYLSYRLGLPTGPVDPIQNLSLEVEEEIPQKQHPGLGVVLGLGLREI